MSGREVCLHYQTGGRHTTKEMNNVVTWKKLLGQDSGRGDSVPIDLVCKGAYVFRVSLQYWRSLQTSLNQGLKYLQYVGLLRKLITKRIHDQDT